MLPTPISTPSVNKSTAKAIISALLSSNGITRAELARECGVSAVTAGKVVTAMCDAGYASTGAEFSAYGRKSEFVYPADRFTFLVFDIGESTLSADIYDARESTRFTYAQPRNESVDITTDARSFLSLVTEQTADAAEEDTYSLSALLYHKESALDADTLCRDNNISASLDRSAAAALYACGAYPNECIAFVGANYSSEISIISGGTQIRGKGRPSRHTQRAVTSELDMLDTLTAKLDSLFEFVIPDKVVIDSRSLHLSRRFSAELAERVCARTNMQKEELPELVTNDGIPFPSRAVIGQLIDIYAELISAR